MCTKRKLMDSLDRYLNLVKAYPEIIENIPLKHVATYLGITDSSLRRIRRELSRH